MTKAPAHLQDAKHLLSPQGFATSNIWYHGTSLALVDSILQHGLKRSGDRAMNDAAKKTMATIGNRFEATVEPVYLVPSKQLAWYWAQQTVRARTVRAGGDNAPAVLAVTLPDPLNARVRPDVGAATLLMLETGEDYMAYLAGIYQQNGFNVPDIDLMNAERDAYLTTLGMAYLDVDIDANFLRVLTD